jgi:sterol desaturase/sphingolipid hydroxylase (fatty acid hydroxylase superfamily)
MSVITATGPAVQAETPAPDRDELRRRAIAAQPRWYNPWAHLAFPSIFGLTAIGIAIAWLRDLQAWELLAVPATLLFANASEWRIHRDMLHKRSRIAPILYERHTPMHHRLYVTQDMSIRDVREFALVLLPAFGIVLILAALLPLGAVVGWLVSPNFGLLVVATDLFYTLLYEWLHLAYHLPPDSRLGRMSLIQRLRRHHATHHDPRLMQRWNFNVTIPFWDWVRGTIWQEPEAGSRKVGAGSREPGAA